MRFFLHSQPRFHLIGEAENIEQLSQLVDQRPADIIVVEHAMMLGKKPSAIRFLRRHINRDRLLLMTDGISDRIDDRGMVVLCSKHAPQSTLVRSLNLLATRSRNDSDERRCDVPDSLLREVRDAENPLSAREQEILQLVAQGLSNRQISAQLSISDQTVKNHVTAVLRKLNATDRAQAVLISLRSGWIKL